MGVYTFKEKMENSFRILKLMIRNMMNFYQSKVTNIGELGDIQFRMPNMDMEQDKVNPKLLLRISMQVRLPPH